MSTKPGQVHIRFGPIGALINRRTPSDQVLFVIELSLDHTADEIMAAVDAWRAYASRDSAAAEAAGPE